MIRLPDRRCQDPRCDVPGGRQFFQPGGGWAAKFCPRCRAAPGNYKGAHRVMRDELLARSRAGETLICTAPECIEETRVIAPFSSFDLGHDETGADKGPEHVSCNRTAGAKKRNAGGEAA